MRPHGTPQALEQRRLLAIRLLETGNSYRSVADQIQSSLSSVVRWHQSYRKEGKKGLHSTPNTGRPPLLSPKQKEKLLQILIRGPLAAGYPTDLWTLQRIGKVIEKQFAIRYSLANCWKLMTALGWSCQKPAKRARERNEAGIAHWKRWVWPHIKKR
jgi:transposase